MVYVDAIEEGKIVRVTEEYAKKENLFVLKKIDTVQAPLPSTMPAWKKRERDEKKALFDDYRKPLHYTKDPLLSELIDNFHWTLLEKRKVKNITRKQLAQKVGVTENDIKLIENGVLPSRDFVLISKLENFYGITLRKSNINYQESFRAKAMNSEVKHPAPSFGQSKENKPETKKEVKEQNNEEISGSDIDIIDL